MPLPLVPRLGGLWEIGDLHKIGEPKAATPPSPAAGATAAGEGGVIEAFSGRRAGR